MNLIEAGNLLATCAAFDNRNESDAATLAWAKALGDLGYADCDQVIVEHYSNGGGWITPGDVRAAVKAVLNARIERAGIPAPPPDLTDDGRAYLRALRSARDTALTRLAIEGGNR